MEHSEQKITRLTTGEVAWLLGTDSNTVQQWQHAGIIKSYRAGGREDRRFRRNDVAQLLCKLGV